LKTERRLAAIDALTIVWIKPSVMAPALFARLRLIDPRTVAPQPPGDGQNPGRGQHRRNDGQLEVPEKPDLDFGGALGQCG